MVLRGEGGEVRADFGQDHLARGGADAVDARQVHTGEAPEGGAGRLALIRPDLALQRIEQPEGERQVEEMLVPRVAGEMPGDLGSGLPTPTVAVLGEPGGIPFPRDDGADNRHAGRPREVGDGAMHLDVHVIQGLLHPLNTPRALGHEIGQLALESAQPGDRLDRAERASEQPAAMEQLKPLTVTEVGLPPRDVVKLAGVDEQDLDAS
jgi:hypothetical protein